MPGVVGRRVGEVGDLADREIAVIFHRKSEASSSGHEAGRSQRRRSHQGAPLRRADFDGSAEQRDSSRDV